MLPKSAEAVKDVLLIPNMEDVESSNSALRIYTLAHVPVISFVYYYLDCLLDLLTFAKWMTLGFGKCRKLIIMHYCNVSHFEGRKNSQSNTMVRQKPNVHQT